MLLLSPSHFALFGALFSSFSVAAYLPAEARAVSVDVRSPNGNATGGSCPMPSHDGHLHRRYDRWMQRTHRQWAGPLWDVRTNFERQVYRAERDWYLALPRAFSDQNAPDSDRNEHGKFCRHFIRSFSTFVTRATDELCGGAAYGFEDEKGIGHEEWVSLDLGNG